MTYLAETIIEGFTIGSKIALVTGAGGFIGSHISDRLVKEGYQVTGIDDLSSGRNGNLPSSFDLRVMDIRDPKVRNVVAEIKPDVVFHLAAQMSVSVSAREPLLDADINVAGSLNLLEGIRALSDKSIKFIHFSSGGTVYGEPTDLPADEETPVFPLSPYAASKLAVETYLPIYERLCDLQHSVIRLGNVYGPRQDPHGEAGVVAIFAQAMLGKKPLKIFGPGTDERDYVYVDDVVDAVIKVAGNSLPGPFNIATGIGTSPNRIFELIAELCDYHDAPVHVAPRAGDIEKIYLDVSKAQRELDWVPSVSFEDGLKSTVEWFRQQLD
ncbi:GDP-mannose 4,6-dehydratase [Dehalococcoides mccartyi]|nr:GDP-mannose 4,6-dehydratase [Dehalococcoides mccartyi]